jgi:hypothetical protein
MTKGRKNPTLLVGPLRPCVKKLDYGLVTPETDEIENVSENVVGAPDDESPSGSDNPTRRAIAYER